MNQETPENEPLLNDEYSLRKQKLRQLRQYGNAFPNDFRRDFTADRLHQRYDGLNAEMLSTSPVTVSVAGRVMTRRVMGKTTFITLQDMGGGSQQSTWSCISIMPRGVFLHTGSSTPWCGALEARG